MNQNATHNELRKIAGQLIMIRFPGTVLDAADSRRVVLFGASEGGPACIRFAVDQPSRVAGLILFASFRHLRPPEERQRTDVAHFQK